MRELTRLVGDCSIKAVILGTQHSWPIRSCMQYVNLEAGLYITRQVTKVTSHNSTCSDENRCICSDDIVVFEHTLITRICIYGVACKTTSVKDTMEVQSSTYRHASLVSMEQERTGQRPPGLGDMLQMRALQLFLLQSNDLMEVGPIHTRLVVGRTGRCRHHRTENVVGMHVLLCVEHAHAHPVGAH